MKRFLLAAALLLLAAVGGVLYCRCFAHPQTTVNVRDFGAVGDGRADDTVAVQRAAARVTHLLETAPNSAALYFPPGVYATHERIELGTRAPLANGACLSVTGAGEASRIVASGTSGVFSIHLADNKSQVEVSQLGLFAAGPDSGTAVSVTMPEHGMAQRRGVLLRDLTIQGIEHEKSWFSVGVGLVGTPRPLISNVMCSGPYGPGVDQPPPHTIGFDLHGTYSPTLTDCASWSAEKGLVVTPSGSNRLEGIFVTRSKFVVDDYGIVVSNEDMMPEGMICENHINARIVGLWLKGKKFVNISHNLFYHQTAPPDVTYRDIELENTEKVSVTDNIFHFPGEPHRVAVEIQKSVEDSVVDNMFNQPGTGILVGDGVLNTRILDNRFFGEDHIRRVPLNTPPIEDHGRGTYVRALPEESGAPGH